MNECFNCFLLYDQFESVAVSSTRSVLLLLLSSPYMAKNKKRRRFILSNSFSHSATDHARRPVPQCTSASRTSYALDDVCTVK
jgi:hypothetical protein